MDSGSHSNHGLSTPDRASVSWALCVGVLCLIGLAATWVVADLVPITHVQDAVALNDFTQLSRPRVDGLANGLLYLLDPLLYTVWGVALVATALLRRRPRVALAVALILPAAPLAAEALKPWLAHAHDQIGWNDIGAASWPSGHSTAAMTLVLSALLVAPRDLRPAVAALGSVFAVAVGFSLLILAWHMPSDVFGGYLLAALFASLAVATVRTTEKRWPSGSHVVSEVVRRRGDIWTAEPGSLIARHEHMLIPLLVLLTVIASMVGAVLMRPHQVELFATDHRSLVVAASGITMLAVMICSTITAGLRR
jgi:membrane-associated phospholipid phosphatase